MSCNAVDNCRCVFQFTPLREGRPKPFSLPPVSPNFNSRPSARGDTSNERIKRNTEISIHAPPRGATSSRRATASRAFLFQFTPLREGRQIVSAFSQSCLSFQFTPLREGRPRGNLHRVHLQAISIHAPPRGATCSRRSFGLMGYFNSRPSARGDHCVSPFLTRRAYFNSRPSARGDCRGLYFLYRPPISIHAPPRGATQSYFSLQSRIFYFNSRPSARGDQPLTPEKMMLYLFQFTPLREGRQNEGDAFFNAYEFQFTPLREGRPAAVRTANPRCNFNSRPSARGDARQSPPGSSPSISIHAPPRGATCLTFALVSATCNFNSRPSARGDQAA